MKTKLLLLLSLIYSISYAQLPDHYVDASATGNNDGSSWNDAYTSLQSALMNAVTGDEIWIAAGTYTPHTTSRNIYFTILQPNISIYGGFAGTETSINDRVIGANETILSGDLMGNDVNVSDFINNYGNSTRNADNSYHIIEITNNGENLILDGITISDSHTNINATATGGAITKHSSIANLTIRNCVIKNNVSRNSAAGIYADFNLANTNGTRGSFVIDKCHFTDNMSRAGSGIYSLVRLNTNVDITISNSLFDKNIVADLSTSLKASSGSSVWLRAAGNGSDAKFNVFNNTFVNNTDQGTATGIIDDRFRATLVISENGNITSNIVGVVSNSIFWNNVGLGDNIASTGGFSRAISDSFENPITSLDVYNSIDRFNFLEGSITSTSNTINSDPIFTDIINGDYTLTAGSPARDTGINAFIFGSTDILNNQRVFNNIVDRGAYEFASTFVQPSSQVFVNINATGNNDGTSWANAYTDLATTISNAVDGDEIWVAAGTYKPATTSRSTYFNIFRSNISIYGGFAGNETSINQRVVGANETILSGDLLDNDINLPDFPNNYANTTRNADNSYHIINIASSGENLLLDGLTISDSHTNIDATALGGAIVKDPSISFLTIRNCIIRDNVSRNNVAGIYADFNLGNTNGSRGSFVIDRCQFTNNMSRGGSGLYSLIGANTNIDITISNSIFDHNIIADLSNSLKGQTGSSIWLRTIGNGSDAKLNIANNTFVNNSDQGTTTGILDDRFRATLVISENGGITSNIIGEVSNSIFWNNTGLNDNASTSGYSRAISDGFENPITSLNVYNSLDLLDFVEGSITSSINTVINNPMFTDLLNGDYTLTATSPAINSGNNSFVFGASDFVGNSRIANVTVDMGAYEFGSTAGINEVEQLVVKLYPNPATTEFTIELDQEQINEILMYNLQGQLVKTSSIDRVNISDLNSGIYLVKVTSVSGNTVTEKLIKK